MAPRPKTVQIHLPLYRVLESQMGDPVLSHWIGPDGIVAGTALGRVSAYLFDVPTLNLSTTTRTLAANTTANSANSGGCNGEKPSESLAAVDLEAGNPNGVAVGVVDGSKKVAPPAPVQGPPAEGRDTFSSLFKSLKITASAGSNKPSITSELPGRYTVFASYSDEAIRACFIHERLLYCMVGTSSIIVYNVDEYKLEAEYPLEIDHFTGYKQILASNNKVLIDCMRSTMVLDPVAGKQTVPLKRLYPANLLDYNEAAMLCYYRNYKRYNAQVILLGQGGTPKQRNVSSPQGVAVPLGSARTSRDLQGSARNPKEALNPEEVENPEKVVNSKEVENPEKVVNPFEGGDPPEEDIPPITLTLPKSAHLVTHGKLKDCDEVVIVCDALDVYIYKYLINTSEPSVHRRLKEDIVAISSCVGSLFLVMLKSSQMLFLDCDTLAVRFKMNLDPATFQLGWPYYVSIYKNTVSFNADEGIYCFKMPLEMYLAN